MGSSHRRGLSIFQDMSAVNTIIGSSSMPTGNDMTTGALTRSSTEAGRAGGVRGRNTHNRGLSIFTEEEVIDKIEQKQVCWLQIEKKRFYYEMNWCINEKLYGCIS